MKRLGTLLIGVLLVIGLVFYVSGGITFHHSSKKNRDTISENVTALAVQETAELKNLAAEESEEESSSADDSEESTEESTEESSTEESPDDQSDQSDDSDGIDLEKEQKKIIKKENDSFSNAKLTRRFRNCIIVGDSIAHAGLEYSWLTEANYSAKIGISINTGWDQINAAISSAPEVMFLSFGVNDIEHYTSHVSKFIKDYKKVIKAVQSGTPSTRIYVCSVFPADDEVTASHSYYQYLDTYNENLEKLCDKMDVTYVDCCFLLTEMPELYDADGIHPVYKFYPLWFTYLADVAGLPKK